MEKSFDTILQSEVDATIIAKTAYYRSSNRFRYQCLCCGEEVYLAAADSNARAPHFRHRRGNNDKNCEQYLGQPGAVEHFVNIRKDKQEQIDFYFNKDRKTFEVSVTFSENELKESTKMHNSMKIRSKLYAKPFILISVNRNNFSPDQKTYFTLSEYSNDYYISFTTHKNILSFPDIIKRNSKFNVFRVRTQDERAKRLETSLLYTGISYIAISEDRNTVQELMNFPTSICIEDEFDFHTLGVDFFGVSFHINRPDYSLKKLFRDNGYQIEISESFDILWPPVYMEDSDYVCADDKIYVYSSFELVPNGNINMNNTFINRWDDNLWEVSINNHMIIYEKNVHVSLRKDDKQRFEIITDTPSTVHASTFVVPNMDDYFLFDKNGCSHLMASNTIYLCETDRIVHYKNAHIKGYILGCPQIIMDAKRIIIDILQYHPYTEEFNPDEFVDISLSETAISYLDKCYNSGRINTVIKRYIKEGLI